MNELMKNFETDKLEGQDTQTKTLDRAQTQTQAQAQAQAFLMPLGFSYEETGDGSPTLRWGEGESMHHMGGAASETVYVYGYALEQYQKHREKYQILQAPEKDINLNVTTIMSMGFGLGYNEILSVLWWLRLGNEIGNESLAIKNLTLTTASSKNILKLISFEKETFLYDQFNLWLQSEEGNPLTLAPLRLPLGVVFDKVLHSLLQIEISMYGKAPSSKEVKEALICLKKTGNWQQLAEVTPDTDFSEKFNIFLFDAFSNNTSPDLWSYDFLTKLLSKYAQKPTVFATYACRSELKKALQACQFVFEKREGFLGKRNATFAALF